ncbi:MAG: hypothetical protein DRQ88_09375 [Epsilonproteobacteria bacterium]|nr:MAG: hypothetical protein DRQ88_09375 [Campylobacterota bacterium]
MTKEGRRAIKTAQIKLREMNIIVQGTDTGPAIVPLGFDRMGVTIEKTGNGLYTISFKVAFIRDVVGYGQTLTDGHLVSVLAVSPTSIDIKTAAGSAPTTASDADFALRIVGSEHSYDI